MWNKSGCLKLCWVHRLARCMTMEKCRMIQGLSVQKAESVEFGGALNDGVRESESRMIAIQISSFSD